MIFPAAFDTGDYDTPTARCLVSSFLLESSNRSQAPFVCRGLMPQPMFAGIFVVVGWGSVEGSEIVHKTLFLLRDRRQTPPRHPLFHLKRASILRYVAIQWFFFAAIIAISETIGAVSVLPPYYKACADSSCFFLWKSSWHWLPRRHYYSHPSTILLGPTSSHCRRAGRSGCAGGEFGGSIGLAGRTFGDREG